MAQTDREVLFANGAFLIGMLQAVGGLLEAGVQDVGRERSSLRCKGKAESAQLRGWLAGTNLWQMRWSMRLALFRILIGFMIVVVAMWIHT